MKASIKYLIIFICFLFLKTVLAQGVLNSCPNYSIDIRKTGTQQTITTGGLKQIINCNPTYLYYIGKDGSTRLRGIYQWNISSIPEGSKIDGITVKFEYNVISLDECNLEYFNVGTDITNPNLNLEDLYNATDYTVTGIGFGYGNQSTNHEIISNFSGQSDPFILAVQNAVSQGRFTLGIAWRYDDPNAGNAEWFVYPGTYTITINYSSPLITIDQKLSTGAQVGTLKRWLGSSWSTPFNPGTQLNLSGQQVILGDQAVYSNQKYHKWLRNQADEPDVLNHHTFIIQPEDYNFTSRFDPPGTGITVRNLLDGSAVAAGNIYFQDPWFIDYADASHGSQLRNRGTSALFISRTSPFVPNFTNSFEYGRKYNGVFLNQSGPPNWNPPYYSVRAPLTQTITVNGQAHTGYFQNWSTSNAQLQQLDPNPQGYDQKAVVFTNGSATVNANYKVTQLSNDATAFSNNSQRKLIETQSGGTWLHQVYTSLGHVWIEHSSDAGVTWILGNNGQPLDGTAGGKNPSIAYYYDSGNNYNYIGVVWQQPSGSHYAIYGQVFNQYAGTSNVPASWSPQPGEIYTEPSDAYSVNANPNIILAGTRDFFIAFERKNGSNGILQPGINWVVGYVLDTGTQWYGTFAGYQDSGFVSGTNASTTNAQISVDPAFDGGAIIGVYLIRQQASPGKIYSHY